ncbi:energy-coupling factor transporter transmembrane component T family protein [Pediococcus cellicola]|uniref:ABC transporter permease n=1 Tax=Pediococcus cellicola TaxID=319652 RepID=A0A0R2IW94_9LACO|nr:energy-coupling factor transporter transmembrane component T [Pediococcus cellicola]KRN66231.1 ABC transporter permease [Pediococcus cellicola]GEL15201.1 cobalt ABC transporter permease [Pediococcus cellicola]
MNNNVLIGYKKRDNFVDRLTGTTKLIGLIALSVIGMVSFDTRFLLVLTVGSLVLFRLSGIRFREVSFVLSFITAFSVLNLAAVYIFGPQYGVHLYGSAHVIWQGIGPYNLTWEQLFYEFNLFLKYIFTIPLALIFLMTTNPSEFSSSLNRIGISYRISYAVSLALRYIPDVQKDYRQISKAQQARGNEISKKGKLTHRVKAAAQILLPLIFTSLDRIETISQAMELRRFGKLKKRSWYAQRPMKKNDFVALLGVAVVVLVGIYLFRVNGGRFYDPFN